MRFRQQSNWLDEAGRDWTRLIGLEIEDGLDKGLRDGPAMDVDRELVFPEAAVQIPTALEGLGWILRRGSRKCPGVTAKQR